MSEERQESHFDPVTYREMVLGEVPEYEKLQDLTAQATEGVHAKRILELGVGTGETADRVLARHPGAQLVGIDESDQMLEYSRRRLENADLRVAKLEDPLPPGEYDLVVAALSVHHLDGIGKADLFRRISASLRRGGRFVLADLVVPEDPDEVVTPIEGDYDKPSRVEEQMAWLGEAGLSANLFWSHRDLAIVVADRE